MITHCVAGLALALVPVTAGFASAAGERDTWSARGSFHVEGTAPDFIAAVVGPYLAIQTALVNDELATVSAAATALRKGAGELGADGQALAAAAATTSAATTMEAARAAFGELSAALIAYADKTRQPVEGKIVAFCPMANKSWVQAEGAIANPYYGKAMATCGSVTKTLSATP